MFELRTPKALAQTAITFDPVELATGTCGLFRAPLAEAAAIMPSMAELIDSVPIHPNHHWDYELDVKVHMMMPGQYPCIPNWHTDMVGRDETGLRFDMIPEGVPPMLLWISDGPETEFLAAPLEMRNAPGSHQEIARFIQRGDGWRGRQELPLLKRHTQLIQPNVWWSMDQQTPHRGTQATKHGWRVFARVTHKSIAPERQRPAHSIIRRHAQVYLDARDFGW